MKIEVRADIAANGDIREATRLTVDNLYNETTDMANSNRYTDIDLINMDWAEFDIHTEMFLADSIRKTCQK